MLVKRREYFPTDVLSHLPKGWRMDPASGISVKGGDFKRE